MYRAAGNPATIDFTIGHFFYDACDRRDNVVVKDPGPHWPYLALINSGIG